MSSPEDAWTRLDQAWQTEDSAAMLKAISDLRAFYSHGMHHGAEAALRLLKFREGVLLAMRQGRWAEARPLFETNPHDVGSIHLAWCIAHLGDPEWALGVFYADDELTDPYRLGGVGAAHFLQGKLLEATDSLQAAMNLGERQYHLKSLCGFYLGEAWSRLGKPDEALTAYELAAHAAPGSVFAERARLKLSEFGKGPYR